MPSARRSLAGGAAAPGLGRVCQGTIGRTGSGARLSGRYTHKTAISHERIVAVRDGQLLFRVRDRERAGEKRIESVPVDTFISRFKSHVLPSGFKRTRHYGVLAICHKREQLARCRATFDVPAPHPDVIETVNAFVRGVPNHDNTRCSSCALDTSAYLRPSLLPSAPCVRGPPS